MKKLTIGLLAFCLFMGFQHTRAQSCSDYYPMTEGVSYELTIYDKKDRVDMVIQNRVVEARKEGSQEVATIHTIHTDKSGKETINADYQITCDGQTVTMDLNSVVSKQMASAMTSVDADIDLSGQNPVIPNGLTVGQTLPDSDIVLKISSGSMKMNFGARISDKKVTGTETVTVPAGTFECLVIEEHQDTQMMISKETTIKVWLAREVGVVKQETYNKKGELTQKEILTKFSK